MPRSLKKGPVIKNKGIKENKIVGILYNINFSFAESNIINQNQIFI